MRWLPVVVPQGVKQNYNRLFGLFQVLQPSNTEAVI